MKRHRDRRGHRASAPTTEHPSHVDPTPVFGRPLSSQARRKQDQLCRQVEERLGLVLAGDIDDPLLQEVYVAGVEPEPGGVNLVVRVALPRPDISAPEVLQRLHALRTFLRGEIAAAIHRKRAPGLLFRVEHGLPGAQEDEP